MSQSFLLHSFPRSGNHLVRAFIEIATKKPTQGCPGNPLDKPILQQYFDSRRVYTKGSDYIALKSHFQQEYLINKQQLKSQDINSSTIIIFREPLAAISSHYKRFCSTTPFQRKEAHARMLERSINLYQESINIAEDAKGNSSHLLIISFEGLVDKNHANLTAFNSLLQFIKKGSNTSLSLSNSIILSKCIEQAKLTARAVKPDQASRLTVDENSMKANLMGFSKQIENLQKQLTGLAIKN